MFSRKSPSPPQSATWLMWLWSGWWYLQMLWRNYLVVSTHFVPTARGVNKEREATIAPYLAKYLRSFWGDPRCDPAALQTQIDAHFPPCTARALSWFERFSLWYCPEAHFGRVYRVELAQFHESNRWRTLAMTPFSNPVDWNENILPAYRLDSASVEDYHKLQIHLSTLTALKDYYGSPDGFTDLHRWASRKRMIYVPIVANVNGTPVGNATVWYDPLARVFTYRIGDGHCHQVPREAHVAMAIDYVMTFRCRDFFIDDKWFPHLRLGYQNPCRIYKDDSVTVLDELIPVGEHVTLSLEHGPTVTPFAGVLVAAIADAPPIDPAQLDACMQGHAADAPDSTASTALVGDNASYALLASTATKPQTTAMTLYRRSTMVRTRDLLPKGMETMCVGRYRPLPKEAEMTTEERLCMFDDHHRTLDYLREQRMLDYAAPVATTNTTLAKKRAHLSQLADILSNKFLRYELQQHEYGEFPVITNPLAIGWRVHDPANYKLYQHILLQIENGSRKSSYVLRALTDLYQQRRDARGSAPSQPPCANVPTSQEAADNATADADNTPAETPSKENASTDDATIISPAETPSTDDATIISPAETPSTDDATIISPAETTENALIGTIDAERTDREDVISASVKSVAPSTTPANNQAHPTADSIPPTPRKKTWLEEYEEQNAFLDETNYDSYNAAIDETTKSRLRQRFLKQTRETRETRARGFDPHGTCNDASDGLGRIRGFDPYRGLPPARR